MITKEEASDLLFVSTRLTDIARDYYRTNTAGISMIADCMKILAELIDQPFRESMKSGVNHES